MKNFGLELLIFWIFFLLFTPGIAQQKSLDKTVYQEFIQNQRAEKDSSFLGEYSPLRSEMLTDFQGLNYYPPAFEYKIEAILEPFKKQKKVKIKNTKGETEVYFRYALLKFKLNNKSYQLIAYQRAKDLAFPNPLAKKRLFIPFYDLTKWKNNLPWWALPGFTNSTFR